MAGSGICITLLRMPLSPYGMDDLRDQVIPRTSAQLCESIQMWVWTRFSTNWTSVWTAKFTSPEVSVLHPLPTNESYCEENIWANNSFWSLWVAPEVDWSAEFYIRTPPRKLCLCFRSASVSLHTPLLRPLYKTFILLPTGKPNPGGERQVES